MDRTDAVITLIGSQQLRTVPIVPQKSCKRTFSLEKAEQCFVRRLELPATIPYSVGIVVLPGNSGSFQGGVSACMPIASDLPADIGCIATTCGAVADPARTHDATVDRLRSRRKGRRRRDTTTGECS